MAKDPYSTMRLEHDDPFFVGNVNKLVQTMTRADSDDLRPTIDQLKSILSNLGFEFHGYIFRNIPSFERKGIQVISADPTDEHGSHYLIYPPMPTDRPPEKKPDIVIEVSEDFVRVNGEDAGVHSI